MLEHGGQLRAAAQRFGIDRKDWLDLSTGINPHSWPVPVPVQADWQRLPEDNDGLEAAAKTYYQADHLLPVAGSQAAIQALPRLRSMGRVGVLNPDYSEHAHVWRCAGHTVIPLTATDLHKPLPHLDVLVLSNPNNPTGRILPAEVLLARHAELAARAGWLVVDEAFCDSTPDASVITHAGEPGLIVLRSLGKFFGLAGARVGFVSAMPSLLDSIRQWLGPWPISGPARTAATGALLDVSWQRQMRQRLIHESRRLVTLLTDAGLAPDSGCALFQWLCHPQAVQLHEQLARQGILVRLFSQPASLRLGLPASEDDWQRLATALQQLSFTRTLT